MAKCYDAEFRLNSFGVSFFLRTFVLKNHNNKNSDEEIPIDTVARFCAVVADGAGCRRGYQASREETADNNIVKADGEKAEFSC